MIDYIKGQLAELTPTNAIIEAAGIGYDINIALPTFSALTGKTECKLFTTEIIREDAHLLYGFVSKGERELFLLLTSISGIGPNTARMIMSGYTASEIRQIIATGNAAALAHIKGIGGKTAQRIIVEVKDKVLKIDLGGGTAVDAVTGEVEMAFGGATNEVKNEATQALAALGFPAAPTAKVVDKLLKQDPTLSVEQVIKQALKML